MNSLFDEEIRYGKLSVYLKALERDAGEEWAAGVG